MTAPEYPPNFLQSGMGQYRPFAGIPDEMMGQDGRVREVWQGFTAHLAGMDDADLAARFAHGDEYLRDAGVFYRQYGRSPGTSGERPWPLSHLPVLVAESEWQDLARGLTERADLLEAVLADLYGEQRLIAGGHLPAGLIAASPEWLRPLVGFTPRGGHFLNHVAFELGRGPDGGWWVLGDRTQAPSGAGFALENRVATARIFAEFYAEAHVHRLTGFFRSFREMLEDLGAPGHPPAILTPGPLNDTYYEHAYIARYLGLMLLEGEDLTVDREGVKVRTVAGPRPISLLWRRIDSAWADRLDLDERSTLGTAGLAGAARTGKVALVNALGSGLVESRAIMAFLPRLAEVLAGRPLAIPNVATWWCGDDLMRAEVMDRLQSGNWPGHIAPALSTRLATDNRGEEPGIGWLRTDDSAPLPERMARDGDLLVAQEEMHLSTTPAHVGGRLVPRPMTLRVFLTRSASGWQVMPGGYARVGGAGGGEGAASALAMQSGGSVADVWVVADRPVTAASRLHSQSGPYRRPDPGPLPSRAADNLFWLGRYVERAEGQIRLLRALHMRLAENGGRRDMPLLLALAEDIRWRGADPAQSVPDSLMAILGQAITAAGRVRDRFSVDGWAALADLDRASHAMASRVQPGADGASAMSVLLRKITGFSGLIHENMYRSTGWRFLSIGRSLERAAHMASLLAVHAAPDAPDGALDLVVELGDSTMSHRRRFAVTTSTETVLDLLALDPLNPRAVLYQLAELTTQISMLPGTDGENPRLAELATRIRDLHQALGARGPDALHSADLSELNAAILGLSDLLSEACLR